MKIAKCFLILIFNNKAFVLIKKIYTIILENIPERQQTMFNQLARTKMGNSIKILKYLFYNGRKSQFDTQSKRSKEKIVPFLR